ncbi:MAG: hypothetical protein JWN43_257, partial [Gammaproteobacteria bacterium]|nr:hypothetical protein [Gammaproteobacteria bacterium]
PNLDPVEIGNAVDVDHEARPNGPLHEQRDQTLAARKHPGVGSNVTQKGNGFVQAARAGIAERTRRQAHAPPWEWSYF